MNITTRTQNDVILVAVAGNLDSNTSPQAQQALDGILAGGGRKMVWDFAALDHISSAGLRVLLGAAKRLRGAGGGLRLFGLNETVRPRPPALRATRSTAATSAATPGSPGSRS